MVARLTIRLLDTEVDGLILGCSICCVRDKDTLSTLHSTMVTNEYQVRYVSLRL